MADATRLRELPSLRRLRPHGHPLREAVAIESPGHGLHPMQVAAQPAVERACRARAELAPTPHTARPALELRPRPEPVQLAEPARPDGARAAERATLQAGGARSPWHAASIAAAARRRHPVRLCPVRGARTRACIHAVTPASVIAGVRARPRRWAAWHARAIPAARPPAGDGDVRARRRHVADERLDLRGRPRSRHDGQRRPVGDRARGARIRRVHPDRQQDRRPLRPQAGVRAGPARLRDRRDGDDARPGHARRSSSSGR